MVPLSLINTAHIFSVLHASSTTVDINFISTDNTCFLFPKEFWFFSPPSFSSCTTSTFLCLTSSGVRIGLFTPDQAFEVVARKQIATLKNPAIKVVGLVTEELQKTISEGLDKVA